MSVIHAAQSPQAEGYLYHVGHQQEGGNLGLSDAERVVLGPNYMPAPIVSRVSVVGPAYVPQEGLGQRICRVVGKALKTFVVWLSFPIRFIIGAAVIFTGVGFTLCSDRISAYIMRLGAYIVYLSWPPAGDHQNQGAPEAIEMNRPPHPIDQLPDPAAPQVFNVGGEGREPRAFEGMAAAAPFGPGEG